MCQTILIFESLNLPNFQLFPPSCDILKGVDTGIRHIGWHSSPNSVIACMAQGDNLTSQSVATLSCIREIIILTWQVGLLIWFSKSLKYIYEMDAHCQEQCGPSEVAALVWQGTSLSWVPRDCRSSLPFSYQTCCQESIRSLTLVLQVNASQARGMNKEWQKFKSRAEERVGTRNGMCFKIINLLTFLINAAILLWSPPPPKPVNPSARPSSCWSCLCHWICSQ